MQNKKLASYSYCRVQLCTTVGVCRTGYRKLGRDALKIQECSVGWSKTQPRHSPATSDFTRRRGRAFSQSSAATRRTSEARPQSATKRCTSSPRTPKDLVGFDSAASIQGAAGLLNDFILGLLASLSISADLGTLRTSCLSFIPTVGRGMRRLHGTFPARASKQPCTPCFHGLPGILRFRVQFLQAR